MNITLLALYNVNSLAIRGLHALLKQNKHKVKSIYFKSSIYHGNLYTDVELWELLDLIQYTEPDLLGVGVHSPLYPLFKTISRLVRERFPDCQIVVGGDHPTANPDECLEYADWVVAGEGEFPILDIVNDNVDKGIVRPERLFELDALPCPEYGFGCYLYKANPATDGKYSWFASRGCHYRCSYCQESIRKIDRRIKSVDKVIEEIEYLKHVFPNMNLISFTDSIFPYDLEWLSEFAAYFKGRGLRFWCATNAANITKEAMKLMKDAGVEMLRFGVQSGSKYIRKEFFNRKDNLDQILEKAHMTAEVGMQGIYDFITQHPYDTPNTLKETRDFIDKLPPFSQIDHFEIRWFPNTPLTNRALKDGYIEEKDVEGNFIRLGNWSYAYGKKR